MKKKNLNKRRALKEVNKVIDQAEKHLDKAKNPKTSLKEKEGIQSFYVILLSIKRINFLAEKAIQFIYEKEPNNPI